MRSPRVCLIYSAAAPSPVALRYPSSPLSYFFCIRRSSPHHCLVSCCCCCCCIQFSVIGVSRILLLSRRLFTDVRKAIVFPKMRSPVMLLKRALSPCFCLSCWIFMHFMHSLLDSVVKTLCFRAVRSPRPSVRLFVCSFVRTDLKIRYDTVD